MLRSARTMSYITTNRSRYRRPARFARLFLAFLPGLRLSATAINTEFGIYIGKVSVRVRRVAFVNGILMRPRHLTCHPWVPGIFWVALYPLCRAWRKIGGHLVNGVIDLLNWERLPDFFVKRHSATFSFNDPRIG